MNGRTRAFQCVIPMLLGIVGLASCRTGADGDPWETLYSNHDKTSDDETSDDETSDDETSDDETSDDETSGEREEEPDDDVGPSELADGGGPPGSGSETEPADVPPAVDSRCAMEKELCNGVDDNCNGEVDEAFACPTEDDGVTGGAPFEGGIYFLGEASTGGSNREAIQRFWPSVSDDYVTGFGPFPRRFRFRRSDWQLFYLGDQALRGQVDGPLETPGCSVSDITAFDFDAANTPYYFCDNVLRRGAGEVIAEDVRRLLGVTDDGRVLAETLSGVRGHYQDGEFHPEDIEISGATPYVTTTVHQDRAVIVAFRDDEVVEWEIMLVLFDEQSHWSVLRRIPTEQTGGGWIGLSDGTLVLSQTDPETPGRRILALPPDGSEQVVWREADATEVTFGGGFLLGPRDPADILR